MCIINSKQLNEVNVKWQCRKEEKEGREHARENVKEQ